MDAKALCAKELEGPLRFRHQLEERVRTHAVNDDSVKPRAPPGKEIR